MSWRDNDGEVEMFDNSLYAEPGKALFYPVSCSACNLDADAIPAGEECRTCGLEGRGK